MAHVFSLNHSPGGVPKTAVFEAEITQNGMEGDRQRHLEFHGGPDRALCLYSLEVILALQQEGHPIFPGATGENLTLTGVDWTSLHSGTRMRIGESLELELTEDAPPCKTIQNAFAEKRFSRILHKNHPGETRWYARVLTGGHLRIGDEVVVQPDQENQAT